MTTMRRALIVTGGAAVLALGVYGISRAAHGPQCSVSDTTLVPSQNFNVFGHWNLEGSSLSAQMDSSDIGTGIAGGPPNFSFSIPAQVPPFTNPGTYTVFVTGQAILDFGPPVVTGTATAVCVPDVLVQRAAATATPTASPAATATPRDATLEAILAELRRLDRDPRPAPVPAAAPQQQQQQQQQQFAPIPAAVSDSAKLPKTGVDAAEVGGVGTLSLLAGVSLMEFARRRRRNWIAPATASEALADTSTRPEPPATSEGDLFLPYWDR